MITNVQSERLAYKLALWGAYTGVNFLISDVGLHGELAYLYHSNPAWLRLLDNRH